jgi:hypothetical protein
MRLATGDYLVEVLDRLGQPMPGWVRIFALYTEAYDNAPLMLSAAGGQSWRIIKCMANSSDLVGGW